MPRLFVSRISIWKETDCDLLLVAITDDMWAYRKDRQETAVGVLSRNAVLLALSERTTVTFCHSNAPPLSPIRSLAYFRPVIDELRAHPAPESYLDYLRLKLRQAATLPANFSDDQDR
jgi:hypothetical protein